ncbi:MAG TPA: hypothetical protein PKB15_04150 [Acidimicrobiia bacterium]|nr:hypothetical protein [Acidimicrobiia bacterium]
MKFIAGLFVENINFRKNEQDSTRIDIEGAFFSFAPPSYPTTFQPHLILLVSAVGSDRAADTLVVEFLKGEEVLARNVQPCPVEPGKFGYRLVKPEIEFTEPTTVIARCTLTESHETIDIPLIAL